MSDKSQSLISAVLVILAVVGIFSVIKTEIGCGGVECAALSVLAGDFIKKFRVCRLNVRYEEEKSDSECEEAEKHPAYKRQLQAEVPSLVALHHVL